MPFIEVKTIKNVFSAEEKPQIIKEITDIFGRMRGDEFAEGTGSRVWSNFDVNGKSFAAKAIS